MSQVSLQLISEHHSHRVWTIQWKATVLRITTLSISSKSPWSRIIIMLEQWQTPTIWITICNRHTWHKTQQTLQPSFRVHRLYNSKMTWSLQLLNSSTRTTSLLHSSNISNRSRPNKCSNRMKWWWGQSHREWCNSSSSHCLRHNHHLKIVK